MSSELCQAFSLCRQDRSAELLSRYQSSPSPSLPLVQRDRQSSAADAADNDDDSSDDEVDPSQVRCPSSLLWMYRILESGRNRI